MIFPIGFSPSKNCRRRSRSRSPRPETYRSAGSLFRRSSGIFIASTQPGETLQEVGQDRSRRRAVDRNEAVPPVTRPAAASPPAPPSRRPAPCANVRPPDPRKPAGCARCVTVSTARIRSAEKPVGRFDSRSNVARKQAGDEEHQETERHLQRRSARASGGAASAGLRRPSSALAGLTADARSAGTRPNSSVTAERQRQRQSPAPASPPEARGAPGCRPD